MDKDLWMLVEELRDQNRHLIEDLTAAKAKGTLTGATADQYASSAPGHHCLAAARPAPSASDPSAPPSSHSLDRVVYVQSAICSVFGAVWHIFASSGDCAWSPVKSVCLDAFKHPCPLSCRATEAAAEESGKLEELQRQLAAVMESKAAEINDDNIRLVNHLSEVSPH